MSTDDFVLVERSGPVAWLTLNEPARLNPVNLARISELQDKAEELSADDTVKVVVLTGAGRGFCAGADLKNLEDLPEVMRPAAGSMDLDVDGSWTLTSMRQPVIALVNGPAVGYGFELAVQADLRVATESAVFKAPFGLLGSISDTGAGSWLLPRIVGIGRAAEFFFTGRTYSATQAMDVGLVNFVVPDDDGREFAQSLASEIAEGSSWSLHAMKRMLYAGAEQGRDEHIMMQYKIRNRQPSISDSRYLREFQQRNRKG